MLVDLCFLFYGTLFYFIRCQATILHLLMKAPHVYTLPIPDASPFWFSTFFWAESDCRKDKPYGREVSRRLQDDFKRMDWWVV